MPWFKKMICLHVEEVIFSYFIIDMLISVFKLVTFMLIFTSGKACKVSFIKWWRVGILDKIKLDNKYSSIPEEYVHQEFFCKTRENILLFCWLLIHVIITILFKIIHSNSCRINKKIIISWSFWGWRRT